ncbi:hypothetical protein ONZ45_g10690 [Pleurotus djamor]|nr:hypothetical protein ONZ45_g10690 [Pleurotus djamor]
MAAPAINVQLQEWKGDNDREGDERRDAKLHDVLQEKLTGSEDEDIPSSFHPPYKRATIATSTHLRGVDGPPPPHASHVQVNGFIPNCYAPNTPDTEETSADWRKIVVPSGATVTVACTGLEENEEGCLDLHSSLEYDSSCGVDKGQRQRHEASSLKGKCVDEDRAP